MMVILTFSVLSTLECEGQKIKMSLGIADESSSNFPVTFGVDPLATDGIDNDLNERELPNLGDPMTLFAAFILPFNPDAGEQKTYTDLRKSSDSSVYKRVFRLDFGLHRVGKARIIWTYPLPAGIDSVRLMDRRGAGKSVDILLDQKEQFIITNEFWDSFLLHVYFNSTAVPIFEEEEEKTHYTIRKSGSHITSTDIKGSANSSYYTIHTIMGELVERQQIQGNEIELPTMIASGTYFINFYNGAGETLDTKTISVW